MAGEQITYTLAVDPAALPSGNLSGMLEALSDLQPLLVDMGEIQREAQLQNWASQGDLFGDPWPALAPSTVREKMRKYGFDLPLIRTGHLQGEVGGGMDYTDTSVTTGFDQSAFPDPYEIYLDKGAPPRNLPARVIVGVSQDEVNTLEETVKAYCQRAGIPSDAISISVGVSMN